jgi:hypothetical protein
MLPDFPALGVQELGLFGDPEECAGICQAAGNQCVGFAFAYGGGPLVLCDLYDPSEERADDNQIVG